MTTIREITKLSNGKELDIKYPIRLFDRDGHDVYYETSTGYWQKREYKDGLLVYYEDSSNFWWRRDYEDGNQVYYENSRGYIVDNREQKFVGDWT